MKLVFNEGNRYNLTEALKVHKEQPYCHIVYQKNYNDFIERWYLANLGLWEPIDEDSEVDITEYCMTNKGLAHDSIRWTQVVEAVDEIIESAEDYIPANKFEAIRKAYGLNKRQFSAMCGVPYRTWLKWESGERECPEYVFNLIEFYFSHREKS